MFVAFCDHVVGNSTSRCSKATRSPWAMRASRISHSTVSNACWPAVVKKRLTERASPAVTSSISGVCELPSIDLLLSSPRICSLFAAACAARCEPLVGCALSDSRRTERAAGGRSEAAEPSTGCRHVREKHRPSHRGGPRTADLRAPRRSAAPSSLGDPSSALVAFRHIPSGPSNIRNATARWDRPIRNDLDDTTTALLFPGQGSHAVGMEEPLPRPPAAAARDRAAGLRPVRAPRRRHALATSRRCFCARCASGPPATARRRSPPPATRSASTPR